MSVRIYTLAKELKLDSKELVDICSKAGIPGKGSALASLSADEVAKVNAFLAGGSAKPRHGKSAPLPPPEPPKRPPAADKKMPVIVTKRKAAPRPAPLAPLRRKPAVTPAIDTPPADVPEAAEAAGQDVAAAGLMAEAGPTASALPAETATAETGLAETGLAETGAVETVAAETVAVETGGPTAIRREDYIGPATGGGKMPVLEERSKRAASKKDSDANGGHRLRPAVKLAPLPPAKQPPAEKKTPAEPAAQKPDMKLPADIVRATASGQSRPLAAHLRRAERVVEAERRQRRTEDVTPDEEAKRGDPARRGKRGARGKGEEDDALLYSREQRQLRRNRPAAEGEDRPIRRITRRHKRTGTNTAAPRKDQIVLELPCTVREFSEAAGIPAIEIQRIMMQEGVMATINAALDPDLAELIAAEYGADVEFAHARTLEEEVFEMILQQEDDPVFLAPRAPVITFLGHVDHGKTSLLDKIIGLDVVSGESGGITQHIRAYRIERDGRPIAFVDTPGHEAFTEMRARGANVTDIAVLVVAADDGVMPQTEEAISHARAAEVPIVVALNKIDLPSADPDRCLQQLSANELLPSEWGGDIEVIKTSAQTGQGIDELLETLVTVAELHEYQANPSRKALGTCLEATQEADRGVVAKMIVQNGTLRVGDVIVSGSGHGRVKAMFDTLDTNRRLGEAGPSTPVNLTGFDVAPGAGNRFFVLDDVAQAREIAEQRSEETRRSALSDQQEHVTLETLFDRLEGAEEVQTLNIIIRADVRGSIEAILKEFEKLEHPEVKIKVLQSTVGGITEADVTLADASDAIIIGFNVVPDEGARQLKDQRGVQIRRYEVIYKITDDLKMALEGMLRPEEREFDLGRALVQRAYKISRVGTIAGCRVLSGTVQRNSRARVIRESTVIGDYAVDTLRREKDDAKEVREGLECGIKLAGFNDVKEADVLEFYRIEEIGRSFDD